MIQQKKKRCKTCGQVTYIWSKGNCKYCDAKQRANKLRQTPKKPLSYKNRGNIPSRRKRPSEGVISGLTNFGFKSQVELFKHIDIINRDSKGKLHCYLTGKEIPYKEGDEMWRSCFAHVLPKGLFPYFKLNPINIKPLLPAVHTKVDNYLSEYREQYPEIDFDRWLALQEEVKERYNEFKKQYLL